MLNAWGFHHLHLGRYSSRKKDLKGFVAQRDELLFVRILDDIIYFIDIKKHDEFESLDILQSFIDNWAHTQPDWRSRLEKGLSLKVSSPFNQSETKGLREAGVFPLLCFDDGIPCLPPNGGMVSSCNSAEDVEKIGKIKQETINFTNLILEKQIEFTDSLRNEGYLLQTPQWRLGFWMGRFNLHEQTTRESISLKGYDILPSLPILDNLESQYSTNTKAPS